MNKIIFLDIDGVLAPFIHNNEYKEYFGIRAYKFEEKCIDVLNEVVTRTNADICISSDWRTYFTLEQIRDIFEDNGFGYTDNIKGMLPEVKKCGCENIRTGRILKFIDLFSINKFITIDDMKLSTGKDYHVEEPYRLGIQSQTEQIIEAINQFN